MEYSKDLVWLYCSNPTTGSSKEEILTIFETRGLSPYQKSKFQDVIKQMEGILEKCLDCRILAQLLLLLQELLPKAKPELGTLWNSAPERYVKTLKHFFTHGQEQRRSCTMCTLVQSSSAYLERELGGNKSRPSSTSISYHHQKSQQDDKPDPILALNCVACKSTDIKRIILSCGHPLCRNCATNTVKNIMDPSIDINHFICPLDRNLCGLKSLEDKLAGVVVQDGDSPAAIKSVGFKLDRQKSRTKVTCPRCDQAVDQTTNSGLLAECLLCDYCFCSKCLQAFHGNNKSCSGLSTGGSGSENGSISKKFFSFNNNPVNHEVSKGASAKQYELDFYKNSVQDLFDDFEIKGAFTSIGNLPPAPEWPWEAVLSSAEGRTPTPSLQYPHPYESLRVGHWVEDELLEKALEMIFHQNDLLQSRAAVLESFVLNWSLRKGPSKEELPRILQEKQIFKKTLVFALINTDTRGHGGHWMLAIIFVQKHKILLFDSSLVLSTDYYQKYFFGLLHILHIAHHQDQEQSNKGFDPSKWKLFVSLDAVQQNNAHDCGPLVVANAYALATWGSQLDRLPKSYTVREWLHHSLVAFSANNKNANNKNGSAERPNNNNAISNNLPKKPYAPTGLIIRFKFFKNCELI